MQPFSIEISLEVKGTPTSTENLTGREVSVAVNMPAIQEPSLRFDFPNLKRVIRGIFAVVLAHALVFLTTSLVLWCYLAYSCVYQTGGFSRPGSEFAMKTTRSSPFLPWIWLYLFNFAVLLVAMIFYSVFWLVTGGGKADDISSPPVSYTISETPRGVHFLASNMGRRRKRNNNRRNFGWWNDRRSVDSFHNFITG